jgi:hypothetical protein
MSSLASMLKRVGLIGLALSLTSCAGGGFSGPTREFSGVWLYEFEGSSFVEGATAVPAERPDYKKTDWLDVRDQLRIETLIDERFSEGDCNKVQPVRLTFIGRRTSRPFGGAGHWGLWNSEVTIDRTISAERLGPAFCYDK